MSFRRFFFLVLCFTLLISGCNTLTNGQVPTLIPEEHLPTLIQQTAQALIESLPPTLTVDPADYTLTPTVTYSPTPEPINSYTPTLDVVLGTPEPLILPDPLPQAEIQIIGPGRLSRILSPLNLHAYLVPPKSDKDELPSYLVSLYDDTGTLLARETHQHGDQKAVASHLLMDIPFQIQGEAKTARLEVSAADAYNRITALTSTDVILLSAGDEVLKSIPDLYANLIIQQPIPSTLIQGDTLVVKGVTRFAPNDQLLVELVSREGNQVGSAVIDVGEDEIGKGYRSFSGEIPYQVDSSSWIRVQVIARDGQFSGIKHLTSVEVLVSP